ncbi:hypothetical protein JW899_04155 [Candidatus Uhrbacteria bacterium]|nr:hypothetical protein [Candidatus Uhrbacteria bacterium]
MPSPRGSCLTYWVRSMFTLSANGRLTLNFGWLDSVVATKLKDGAERIRLTVSNGWENKYPSYPAEEWVGWVDGFPGLFGEIVQR